MQAEISYHWILNVLKKFQLRSQPIEYDPNRTAFIALLAYADERRYRSKWIESWSEIKLQT
jgi:ribosomal protein L2